MFYRFSWLIVAGTSLLATPTVAQPCRLALVMAMDVSRSVDSTEFGLQFRGVAAAFRDAEVQAALLDPAGPIGVMAFEWSGETYQTTIAEWSLLVSREDIHRFAAAFENHQRTDVGQKTAIGPAVQVAKNLLEVGPDCTRRTIDVSGDGDNNEGPTPHQLFSSLDFDGITVNALVVGGKARPELLNYFYTEVLHGPEAFAIGTEDYSDYADAIRQKLIRELSPPAAIAAK